MPDDSIPHRIFETIAARQDRSPAELPRLFEVVDPEALSALFASPVDGPERNEGSVTFPYCGYRVTVSAAGTVSVEPIDVPVEEG